MKESEVTKNLYGEDEYLWSAEMRKIRCEDLFARIERAAELGLSWSEIVEVNACLASDIFAKKPIDKAD